MLLFVFVPTQRCPYVKRACMCCVQFPFESARCCHNNTTAARHYGASVVSVEHHAPLGHLRQNGTHSARLHSAFRSLESTALDRRVLHR